MTLRTRILGGVAVCLATTTAPLGAQLIRVPMSDESSRPIALQVHAGYFQSTGRFDGQSGVAWALGEAFQYRVGVDVGLRSGSLGLTGTVASVPIAFSDNPSADGEMQFRQLLATFRSPEAQAFHQVLEVSAGWSQWGSYSGDNVLSADERKARNAVTISIGYGFAFPMGARAAVTLVQDAATTIGSSEGLPSGARRSQTQYITRLGLRYRLTGGR